MSFFRSIENVGIYALLLRRVITIPDRMREFMKEFFKGIYQRGKLIWIVLYIFYWCSYCFADCTEYPIHPCCLDLLLV